MEYILHMTILYIPHPVLVQTIWNFWYTCKQHAPGCPLFLIHILDSSLSLEIYYLRCLLKYRIHSLHWVLFSIVLIAVLSFCTVFLTLSLTPVSVAVFAMLQLIGVVQNFFLIQNYGILSSVWTAHGLQTLTIQLLICDKQSERSGPNLDLLLSKC